MPILPRRIIPSPPPPPESSALSQIYAYLNENLIKSGLATITVLGALSLLSYFLAIDYFPIFDFKAASLLASVAFVTGIFVAILSPSLLLPYLYIGLLAHGHKPRSKNKLIRLYCMFAWLSIAILYGLWTCVDLGMSPIVGIFAYFAITALLALALSRVLPAFRGVLSSSAIARRAVAVAALQLLPCWILVIFEGTGTQRSEISSVILGLETVAVIGTLALWQMYFHPNAVFTTLLGTALFFALPVLTTTVMGKPGALPLSIATVTKIGNFHVQHMTISSSACDSIGPLLSLHCDAKQPTPISICNVHIMSRVGPETYLRLAVDSGQGSGKREIRSILVPSAEVRALRVDFESRYPHRDKVDSYLMEHSWQCKPDAIASRRRVTYANNSYLLGSEEKAKLQPLIDAARQSPELIQRILVTGHADAQESNTNERLSQRRADSVALYLLTELNASVPGVQIKTASAGKNAPLAHVCVGRADIAACHALNRRAEVELVSSTMPVLRDAPTMRAPISKPAKEKPAVDQSGQR